MLDNLEKVLKIMFGKVSPEMVFQERIHSEAIRESEFVRMMRGYEGTYSDTELSNLYDYLVRNFESSFFALDVMPGRSPSLNVFHLLFWYGNWILTIENGEILCQYKWLLHWRMSTISLSEDLFIAAFLAYREKNERIRRTAFGWKPVITHNNVQLHRVLEHGMSENHYHLKGSGPIFHLSWISIMNDIMDANFLKYFRKLDSERRMFHVNYDAGCCEAPFEVQILQAALIRVFLCYQYMRQPLELCEENWYGDVQKVIQCLQNPEAICLKRYEIQGFIRKMNRVRGLWHAAELPDYALNGLGAANYNMEEETAVYQGERWFLYTSFWYLNREPADMGYLPDLLYAYILIKENIRSELIQSNNYIGFENFQIYQDRKEFFLESPFYQRGLVREAVRNNLLSGNVLTLEARIAPKESAEKMMACIRKLDNFIVKNEAYKSRFFYTVHFIKETEKMPDKSPVLLCRDCKVREKAKKGALALADMRERYPEYAVRIRGIDAASQEISCRPEVFAQVFRFLSDHVRQGTEFFGKSLPQLRMTYHVGEDFFDILSGIRAIDEAIHFLNMPCGARMGHALALGVDVEDWYRSKNNRILLSQQEYLDNVVWLYHVLAAFRIEDTSAIKEHLKKEYDYYFQLIYGNSMDEEDLDCINRKAREYYQGTEWENYYRVKKLQFSIETYYAAWRLRGDDPDLYRRGFFENRRTFDCMRYTYSFYAVNRKFPQKRQDTRYFQENALLYYYYHFDWNVRYEGGKRVEIKILPMYKKAVAKIQKEMQRRVAEYGIGIETNPSSNYLIGTFKRYDKHPIIQFYNRNLTNDWEQLADCPQLCVSINTDDSGVFSVSLENEYAYMALALEKMKDQNGRPLYNKSMIYQWLDDIRNMGIGQTFLDRNEMVRARQEWEGSSGSENAGSEMGKKSHSTLLSSIHPSDPQ